MSSPNTIGITPGRVERGFALLTTADVGANPRQTPSSSVNLYTATLPTVSTKVGGGRGNADGARLLNWSINAAGTTALGTVCLYAYDQTTYQLIDEVIIPVYTAATTTSPYTLGASIAPRSLAGIYIGRGWSVTATTLVAQSPGLMVALQVEEF